ncbi:MAG: aminotransferase class IV [Planctomycetaceae bacterium]|jgi:branched-subunit amino acid aminotransferase/4-amino-4-deoxychorismate lyase
MDQLAWFNGQQVPSEQLSVSVTDAGFVQGATVSEQFRTFGGRLFQLDEHMRRLSHSLNIIGIDDLDIAVLKNAARSLVSRNHSLLQPGDDLGLTLFVTPGPYAALASTSDSGATVGMHTSPLGFHRWHDKYTTGETLVVSSIRQVPASCWPTELKCRSRMHYFLADREAARIRPGARAVLLDQNGFLAEASTASVVLFRVDEGLVAPMEQKVLPSVSVGVFKSLAQELDIAFLHRDVTPDDMVSADEMFLSSTSPCLLPVAAVDGSPIGAGVPGKIFRRIMDAWSRRVGIDIVDQATTFANRHIASAPQRLE